MIVVFITVVIGCSPWLPLLVISPSVYNAIKSEAKELQGANKELIEKWRKEAKYVYRWYTVDLQTNKKLLGMIFFYGKSEFRCTGEVWFA